MLDSHCIACCITPHHTQPAPHRSRRTERDELGDPLGELGRGPRDQELVVQRVEVRVVPRLVHPVHGAQSQEPGIPLQMRLPSLVPVDSQSVSQSVSQSIGRSVSRSFSRPVSQYVTKPTTWVPDCVWDEIRQLKQRFVFVGDVGVEIDDNQAAVVPAAVGLQGLLDAAAAVILRGGPSGRGLVYRPVRFECPQVEGTLHAVVDYFAANT